jgi:hypothetical protein
MYTLLAIPPSHGSDLSRAASSSLRFWTIGSGAAPGTRRAAVRLPTGDSKMIYTSSAERLNSGLRPIIKTRDNSPNDDAALLPIRNASLRRRRPNQNVRPTIWSNSSSRYRFTQLPVPYRVLDQHIAILVRRREYHHVVGISCRCSH